MTPSSKIIAFPKTHDRQDKRRQGTTLNKTTAKKLALPAGKNDFVYWDNVVAGFGLRIRAGGKRSWIVQYRVNSVMQKATIGPADAIEPDDARNEARRLIGDVAKGSDPAKVKRQVKALTKFGELVEPFLAYAGDRQKPSTHEATTRNLRTHAKALHATAVRDIGRSDISRLHERVSEKSGPVQANRVLAALSGFFAWAVGKGHLDLNPVMAVPKNAEKPRERVLSDDEIRTIWKGTDSGSNYDRILRLLLLTGTRRTEVGSMRWEEVNGNGLWTVPAERMKNGLPHEVSLSVQAQACLPPSGEGATQTGFVFGKTIDGDRRGYSGWSRSKARLDGRLKLPAWGLHDFRRTMSTRLHEADIQPHIVEALLAHVSGHKGGVAGVYNKASYRDQKRQALELWASMIEKIVRMSDLPDVSQDTK